jgi:hypothetical protein
MLVAAAPAVFGAIVLIWVPESPSWLLRQQDGQNQTSRRRSVEVFSRIYLRRTLIGIGLGTVPVLGNWGSVNWLMTWADQAGSFIGRPDAKAWTQIARSAGGAFGSLLGGWAASLCGRRWSYFLISLASLLISQYVFGWLHPQHAHFLFWTTALGFVSTIYFGWLPLFLPELFPVAVRSQGAGVSFNFGRYLSAIGVLATGLLKEQFAGDYARVGRITSFVFAVGLLIIWLAPDTSRKSMVD